MKQQSTKHIYVKVMLSNGTHWVTRINADLDTAKKYFLGKYFEQSDELHSHECVSVEKV